jgi:UPF0755 protein
MKKIVIVITLLLLLFIGFFTYYKEGQLPVNKKDKSTKIFIIKPGESITNIAKNLQNEDLIRNKIVFYWIVKQLNIGNKIQAGDFRLSPSMSATEIAQTFTKGTLDVWVTVIEGLRKEQIAPIFSKEFNIPEVEFVKVAKEGYLFPDTYLIPKDATLSMILTIFQSNFNKKYTPEISQKVHALGLTDTEALTIASIVEKEAIQDQEKQEVASIILKRFKNDWNLQLDPTVSYALGYQENEETWWKQDLTFDDLKIDSPYNTYKYKGLPPGPIDSPGLVAIEAVANANVNTPYWYYLSDKKGVMHYGKTDEDHQANIKKYLE